MTNAVRQIIAAANNALLEDDDDFEQVVSHTRRSFRRRHQNPRTPRKGRRTCNIFKRRTLLLRRANVDYCPIKTELETLTSYGLGYSDSDPKFLMDWNIDELEDYICSLYPKVPLQLVGFKLGKMNRQKKIIIIDVQNVAEMKEVVGQSQIVIIPNRDLRLDTTLVKSTDLEPVKPNESDTILTPRTSELFTRQNRNVASTSNPPDDVEPVNYEHEFLINNGSKVSDDCEWLFVIPTIDDNAEVFIINVIRGNCFREMFNYYEDRTITEKRLSVSFKDEVGLDSGGLTKELFSLFFKEAEGLYFKGENCLVPFLPLNRIRKDKSNFILIGRILEHMLLLTGSIPSKLSLTTLLLIANPNAEIDKQVLVNEFYSFVNSCEKLILKKSINDFDLLNSKEKDILSNIFNTYHFYEMPSKTEIFEQVASIALNTLVEAPRQFIETMRKGINTEKYISFWNRCDFSILLEMQKPTASKLANCLKTESETLTNEQTNTLHFLEMYIRCLHDEKVAQFVFLATGAYQMPEFIYIQFSNLVGLAQRPIYNMHKYNTCSLYTYLSYQELRRDFDLCLSSEETYVYTSY
ncbi:hypothetical protein FQR65_LT04140 [Abscondita terminalis]|nr:hypothetical protein FQR65_LT04140 [Abscondita terminalis]